MQLTGMFKPGSRIRWLLSETLVVVLGVLIALGLNDYWSFRQERNLELQYVERIHADVNGDIEFSDRFVQDLLERKFRALDAIAPIVRGKEPVPEDVESFLRNVALGGLGGASSTHWVTSTTFEDLKFTGNLRLIRDADLRTKIVRYYDEFDTFYTRSRDRKTGYVDFVHSLLPAELREDMNLAAMDKFGTDLAIKRFTSIDFRNLLNQEYNYAFFNQRSDRSSSAKRLVKDLETYIQQLKGSR